MHSEGRGRLHLGAATDWLPRWLAVVFPFSIAGAALGQGYLVPPPGFGGAPSTPQPGVPTWTTQQAAQQAGDQAASSSPSSTTTPGTTTTGTPGETQTSTGQTAVAPASAPVESLMEWGALHLHARMGYQFLYDSGLHDQPGKSTDTYSQTVTPGITIMVGPHVTLDYSPSFRFFSQRGFRDTIDHFVSLTAGASYGEWAFGLSQSYSKTDEPLVQTSSQTDEQDFSTGLNASYHFSDKVSFETSAGLGMSVLGGNQTVQTGGTNAPLALTDSTAYSLSEWVDYKFDQKLDAGVGVTLSYSEQNGGFRSLSEMYQGRVSWRPGQKLSISLTAGMQDEQFLNSDAPDILTPIFSATAAYQLFEQTMFSITASRSVSASLFQSQVTESTQFGAGIQQRLLGHLQFTAGYSYVLSDYKLTFGKFGIARSDTSSSYSVGLNLPFLKRCNFSTFYSYTQNSSSEKGFAFSSSEAGATLSWAY